MRYETNEFPRHNSGSARHCDLYKSVLLGAHWRAVVYETKKGRAFRDGRIVRLGDRGREEGGAPRR